MCLISRNYIAYIIYCAVRCASLQEVAGFRKVVFRDPVVDLLSDAEATKSKRGPDDTVQVGGVGWGLQIHREHAAAQSTIKMCVCTYVCMYMFRARS